MSPPCVTTTCGRRSAHPQGGAGPGRPGCRLVLLPTPRYGGGVLLSQPPRPPPAARRGKVRAGIRPKGRSRPGRAQKHYLENGSGLTFRFDLGPDYPNKQNPLLPSPRSTLRTPSVDRDSNRTSTSKVSADKGTCALDSGAAAATARRVVPTARYRYVDQHRTEGVYSTPAICII